MINYLLAFLSGLVIGIPMCFSLGPVFFALIQNSLSNGIKSAFFIASGVIIADIILFGAAYTGTHLFIEGQNADRSSANFWVELLGGSILVLMGYFTIRKHVKETNERKFFNNPVMYFMRGFVLNFLNPMNFFAWVVLIANVNVAYVTTSYRFTFYIATLISIFSTEIIISFFAARITKVLNARTLRIISTGNGLIFMGCGIWLLGTAFGYF
ncbi:MAG: LysE family transporter [Bacteroidetes bacterium]|nr:LysE family transporter [Bacteroidota bacterium]